MVVLLEPYKGKFTNHAFLESFTNDKHYSGTFWEEKDGIRFEARYDYICKDISNNVRSSA